MTDNKQALLPCPFCGCKPHYSDFYADGWHFEQVLCENKSCVLYDEPFDDVKAWNTRADQTEQYTHTQQLIEKLEGQLGQYDICDDIAIGYDQAIYEVIAKLRGEDE